jgi:hypothetical protein
VQEVEVQEVGVKETNNGQEKNEGVLPSLAPKQEQKEITAMTIGPVRAGVICGYVRDYCSTNCVMDVQTISMHLIHIPEGGGGGCPGRPDFNVRPGGCQ